MPPMAPPERDDEGSGDAVVDVGPALSDTVLVADLLSVDDAGWVVVDSAAVVEVAVWDFASSEALAAMSRSLRLMLQRT